MILITENPGHVVTTRPGFSGCKKYARRSNINRTRGIIKNRVDISQRPAEVNAKNRFGDLEIDTIIGKGHKGAIMTINDRCTSLTLIRKLEGKEAAPLAASAIDALSPYKHLLHTITADNGKEFAAHQDIAKALDISFFFAKPYHSWERGANENRTDWHGSIYPRVRTSMKCQMNTSLWSKTS